MFNAINYEMNPQKVENNQQFSSDSTLVFRDLSAVKLKIMALVSAFLGELCQKLEATIAASDQLPLGVDKELERLLKAFSAIQVTTLEAAEDNQSKSKDVQAWLCELKEAAYDADDLLDCLVLKAQEPEVEADDTETVDQEQPVTRTEIMIRDIRKRVQKLMRKKPFSLDLHGQQSSNCMSHEAEARRATTANSRVFGRDEDREKMIQLLTSEESSSHEDLSLIAIVGRIGAGKTTLARIVYVDHRVSSHFQLKMWVTASEVYGAGRLLRSIKESVDESLLPLRITEEEAANILEYISGKSPYLLILDDVRNEILDWEVLLEQLKDGASGNKIVITTENEEIAKKMRLPFLSYHLQGLSHGDSWSLFKECASLLEQGACQNSKEIEEFGSEILAKSEGLPLAVRMVGRLLRLNFDLNDWKMILNADVWRYKSEELCGIPAALWLSYQHLPPHIKQCFGYCSVFPRGHKFDKQSTVHMWIVQGLIQPQEGKQMEDLGNEYFDYLLNRSFFQNWSFRDNSIEYEFLRLSSTDYVVNYTRPKSLDISEEYIMHGLIHDLALSITACESLCLSPVARSMKKNLRHLSVQTDKDTIADVLDIGMLHNLRTLLLYRTGSSSFDYDALFMNLKCIRVLCLSDTGLMNLPDSIGNLKQLRCLDLAKTSVDTVPEVLCGLRNLESLKLSLYPQTLPILPRGMSNLINLRHLHAHGSHKMYKIGQLTSLQELEYFSVIDEDGHRIGELKNMKQLRGKVCISRLGNVHTKDEAMEAKLNEKEHIDKLKLEWYWGDTSDGSPIESNLASVEGLRPHANLKDLSIWYNRKAKMPTWLEDGSLSSLEALEIRYCPNWDIMRLGQFKSLKILRLHGLLGRKHLDLQNGRDVQQLFPCLRILDIWHCPWFTEVPLTLEAIELFRVGLSTLPRLHQSGNPTSTSSSLASLRICECERLTTLQAGLLSHRSQIQLQSFHMLIIQDCTELVHLPDHGFSALVSLRTLRIENCPKLRHQQSDNSGATLPSSLIDFRVLNCKGLTSDSFFIDMVRLHSLRSMLIEGEPTFGHDSPPKHLPVLTSLPWRLLQHLKSLKELEIVDCEWLTTLELRALVSLKRLKIAGCLRLAACSSPSDKSPMLLEYLEIKNSSLQILNGELLQSLIHLQELKIMECDHLVKFPNEMEKGLHCLVSLKRLFIDNCRFLRSLPCELATIPSLEELCVTYCNHIQSMPKKGLPASLFMLVIRECRRLKRRCKKDGEDWSKISHIFYIEIERRNVKEETLSETLWETSSDDQQPRASRRSSRRKQGGNYAKFKDFIMGLKLLLTRR